MARIMGEAIERGLAMKAASHVAETRGAESLLERLAPYGATRVAVGHSTYSHLGSRLIGAELDRAGSRVAGRAVSSVSRLEDRLAPYEATRGTKRMGDRLVRPINKMEAGRVGGRGTKGKLPVLGLTDSGLGPMRTGLGVRNSTGLGARLGRVGSTGIGAEGLANTAKEIDTLRAGGKGRINRMLSSKKAKIAAGAVVGLAGYGAIKNRHGRAIDPMGAGRPTGPFVY